MAGDLEHCFFIAEPACLCNYTHSIVVLAHRLPGDGSVLPQVPPIELAAFIEYNWLGLGIV